MKKILLVLMVCALALTSCGPDPVKFNDSIINYVEKSHDQTTSLEGKLQEAIEKDDYSIITESVPAAMDSLNQYKKAIESLETPKNGEEFKSKVVVYLNSLTAMVDSYKTLSGIKEDSSQEDIDKITQAITDKEDEVEKIFEEVQTVQVAYAKANNMKLQ